MPTINENLGRIKPYSDEDIVQLDTQHDRMIETYEPAVTRRPGHWEDYWSISTWSENRRDVTPKAALSIAQQSHTKRKWRLKYLRARSIPPVYVNRLDGRIVDWIPLPKG